jgi:predicted dehydrogenase
MVVDPPTHLPHKPKVAEMKTGTIRIGVIGAGRWGPNVIGSLIRVPQVEVAGVSDLDEHALSSLSHRFPGISTSTNTEDVLTANDIDAVAICTPVDSHLQFVEKALQAGKHVFVEKPFGRDSEECRKLADLAEERELSLMVGHVFLFNASILALKTIITGGELGKLFHLEAHRTNLGPVRKDVNAVWDLTSHDLSIFDFLLDSNPEAVSCIGSPHLDPKIEDTTFTTFQYPNGILAHAHASWLNPRKVRQITVVGSEKMALWDDLNLEHPLTIYDSSIGLGQSYYSDSFTSHRLSYHRGDVTLPTVPTNEPLYEELSHFVKVIKGEAEARSDGRFGTEIARTLETADRSLASQSAYCSVNRLI